jgi:hypothetical protein
VSEGVPFILCPDTGLDGMPDSLMTMLGKCARSQANSAEPLPRVSIPARDYSDVDLSATDAIVLAGVRPARRAGTASAAITASMARHSGLLHE